MKEKKEHYIGVTSQYNLLSLFNMNFSLILVYKALKNYILKKPKLELKKSLN